MTKKSQGAAMGADQFPKATQDAARLAQAADRPSGEATSHCIAPGNACPSLAERANQISRGTSANSAEPSCQQSLRLAFFFDGTGNNLEADTPTDEHSNVARMFMSHLEDNEAEGRFRFYLPGIGTYFKEIGDPGGTTTGLGFGARGQDRLDWAFQQFEEKLKAAEARALNPTNKITMIQVAAFGFSRGATLARAFARDFQARCRQVGGEWRLRTGGHPARFYFLGLWDTVASVGLPMSANNTPGAQSLGWIDAEAAMRWRNQGAAGVNRLAFGTPGADPAPGPADGHASWAHPLDVPTMVEKCVHMVAAHEIRNSFPVDSCRRGKAYPDSVEETVYPGVHSDVGGGYRPGEGARSDKPGQMLSLIPLRVMHKKAWEAGVPIYPLNGHPDPNVPAYFAADPDSEPAFSKLVDLWTHYVKTAGWGGQSIGEMVNAHMRCYYAWRFRKIRGNREAHGQGEDTADQATLRTGEAEWRKERTQLEREMKPLKAELDAAERQRQVAQGRLNRAEMEQQQIGVPVKPSLRDAVADAENRVASANDPYLKLKARYDTLPGTDGLLGRNLDTYDAQLVADAQAIRQQLRFDPRLKLRPHYRGLLEAYEAEFEQDNGLRDEKIISFFDHYVHDSLAGFARDATLPSDPRVIYIGDDIKSEHARMEPVLGNSAMVEA